MQLVVERFTSASFHILPCGNSFDDDEPVVSELIPVDFLLQSENRRITRQPQAIMLTNFLMEI